MCFGFFCVCFTSVSSALLPHAAAEKKGASRGGHSGEGRLNRPPPLASVGAGPTSTPPSPPTLDFWHHRSLSKTRSFTVWVETHSPFLHCRGSKRKLVIMSYLLFSPASLRLFTSEKQLFISPKLTPAETIGCFSWKFFKARISSILSYL